MATSYPGALDSYTNPASTNTLNSPAHASQHADINDAVVQVETKLGTTGAAPTNNFFLVGTGAGTSAWTKAVPTGAVVGISDTQTLTNKTLTTPTIASIVNTGTLTLPTSTDTLVGRATTDTLTNKTLTTPTIGDFSNSTHNHENAAGGGTIDREALPDSSAVQFVSSASTAVATGTTVLPYDDTIPQSSEGVEVLTRAITPLATTDILRIQSTIHMSHSAISQLMIALFQDSTADALAATASYQPTATGPVTVNLDYSMAAGTTSSTTFKIRIGGDATGTVTLNGQSAARRFGGVSASTLKITEYKL